MQIGVLLTGGQNSNLDKSIFRFTQLIDRIGNSYLGIRELRKVIFTALYSLPSG